MATCIAVCFLIALPLAAQDARKVEEPEYVNSAFRLDANAALTPLERQTGHPVTKPQGLGHVASKVLVFPGDRSPVRFTAGDNLEFVVRVERRDVDPQTSIQFYILKPAKGKRELIVVKAGSMGISSKSTIGECVGIRGDEVWRVFIQDKVDIGPASRRIHDKHIDVTGRLLFWSRCKQVGPRKLWDGS